MAPPAEQGDERMSLADLGSVGAGRASSPPNLATLDVTVLAGGPGVEREVSLDSGEAVGAALGRLGHRVSMRDIGPDDLSALSQEADFVFIALHGEFGEDGTVQGLLDKRDLRYSGSGAEASRLAMDKVASKRSFERAAVPTPAYEVVDRSQLPRWSLSLEPPVIVKPVGSGSSVDTVIARTPTEVRETVTRVATKYGQVLVERYVAGPELTVSVLGDRALPVCEIRPQREFYDYQAKYLDDDTQYLFEIALPAALLRCVQRLSLAAHQALGCSVFSRVDWMVDRETLEPFALEVNTIPGFTSHSLFPKAAARIGLSFDQFCQRIIELSWNRG